MEIWQNPEFGGWWWTDYPGLPDYPYPGPQYTWMERFKKQDAGYVQNDADERDGAAPLMDIQDMPSVMVAASCLILLTLIGMVMLILSLHSFLFSNQGH